jgi:hypothetical protein
MKRPILRIALLVAITVAIGGLAAHWEFIGRLPNPDITAFGSLLGTLFFASAILERAMDVWLSLVKGGMADQLDADLRVLKAQIASSAPEEKTALETQLASLVDKRVAHQNETRQLASPVSLVAGIIISAIGLRSLQPLFEKGDASWLHSRQGHVFSGVDIIVTGTLLAGGSDGIHWIVALYRDWTDKNRNTSR